MTSLGDLAIVGGGPIGLATALYADGAGLDVVVLEPRSTPVDKACGEGLMPSALERLAELGVDPPGRSFAGIRYLDASGARAVTARFGRGRGRGVRRTTLHQALSDAVVARGVTTMRARMVDLRQRAGHVTVETSAGESVSARYVVGADGLHSRARRTIGVATPVSHRPRFGLRRHFAVAPWTDVVEVHWADGVEAYVTPVDDDCVGVAMLTSLRGSEWDDLLTRFPLLQQRLSACDQVSAVMGAGPLRQAVSASVIGRVLLVGDAAGYVDALTGEGIAVGLASAQAAVAAIVANDPRAYEQRWRQVSRSSRWLTHGALFAAQHPTVRRAILPVCSSWPAGFQRVVNRLA